MNPSSPTHTHTSHTLCTKFMHVTILILSQGLISSMLFWLQFVVLFEQLGHGSKMLAVCCRMKMAAHWDDETWSKPYKIINYLQ